MWLYRRAQPGLESITVWLQSHGLQDRLGEERVSTDEANNTEEKKETTEAKGDPATVSGRFLVATSFKQVNVNFQSTDSNTECLLRKMHSSDLDIENVLISFYSILVTK